MSRPSHAPAARKPRSQRCGMRQAPPATRQLVLARQDLETLVMAHVEANAYTCAEVGCNVLTASLLSHCRPTEAAQQKKEAAHTKFRAACTVEKPRIGTGSSLNGPEPIVLGVDSPFCSTIVLFKHQLFSLDFFRFSKKKDPWKNGHGRYP